MDNPALKTVLLRLRVDARHVPQRTVNAWQRIAEAELAGAHRHAIEDLIGQQAHRQVIGDQRQQAGWPQRQYLIRGQNTGRFKQATQPIHYRRRNTRRNRNFIALGHIQ